MTIAQYIGLILASVFVQNFVLSLFLGLCPFVGVSKRRDAALGMGMAVIFVMTLACVVTMLIYKGLFLHPALEPYKLHKFLDIVAFILVIASLVQFVEVAMKKMAPGLYKTLGIYLPLITTNCAILGATQLKLSLFAAPDMGLGEAVLANALLGVGGGVGFTLALFLMAGIRERLETAPVPEALRGVPIAFIAGGCMALAFFGFAGILEGLGLAA